MIISRCTDFGKSQLSKNIKRSLTRKQRAEKKSAYCFDDQSDKEEGEDADEHFSCNLAVDFCYEEDTVGPWNVEIKESKRYSGT